ncbi:MAG: hypothetical protein L6262_08390 [Weeksellaceae bacterium]|nr:hypothetical protein [Weeksellaceae bacterium]
MMIKIATRILLISALTVSGFLTTSCSNVEDLVDDITVPIPFTIPLSLEGNIPLATVNTEEFVSYPEIPINVDAEAKIKQKYPALSINNLKSGQLDSFSIEYISSTGGTKLDAILDAELYLKTPDLPPILVAKSVGNTNPTAVSFTPEINVELLPYLQSKQNSFFLRIRGSREVADAIKITVNMGFKVVVGL